jgi:hypothetical protein
MLLHPNIAIMGSVAKNKKRLYLIFQPAVFKQLLNSLYVKINFLQQSPFFQPIG